VLKWTSNNISLSLSEFTDKEYLSPGDSCLIDFETLGTQIPFATSDHKLGIYIKGKYNSGDAGRTLVTVKSRW